METNNFLISLLGFSFQNETLLLDDLLYLNNVNDIRHMSAEEKTEKDINTCFYRLNYLACKRGYLTALHYLLIFFVLQYHRNNYVQVKLNKTQDLQEHFSNKDSVSIIYGLLRFILILEMSS